MALGETENFGDSDISDVVEYVGDEEAVPDLSTESELTRVTVIRLDALLIGEDEADEEAHVVPLGVPFTDTVDDGVPVWLTEAVGFVVNVFSAAVPVTEFVGIEDFEKTIVRESLVLTQMLTDIVTVTEVVKDDDDFDDIDVVIDGDTDAVSQEDAEGVKDAEILTVGDVLTDTLEDVDRLDVGEVEALCIVEADPVIEL